ncbi:MAG: LysR family glycine cleavage system transcriptional activator [Myxococcota bacterium]|jgi:LysR family glycine cleavage system transcriptional activator
MGRLPDVDSLRCFVAAAERQHFRLASRAVGLSPAAFSDRIRRLEESLGASLFDRTTRSVAMTAAGERLLPEARRCLEAARACQESVADLDRPTRYTLTIGTRFELGLSWLVPALDLLQVRQPERTVQLSFAQSLDLMARLRSGELDAFVSSIRLSGQGLRYAVLHDEDYVFIGTPRLLAAAHTLVDVDASLPLFRYLLDGLGEFDEWPFPRRELMGTIAAIRARVLAGRGVAVLPRYFVQPDLDAGRLVRILPEVTIPSDVFRLIWSESNPQTQRLRLLAEELREIPLS